MNEEVDEVNEDDSDRIEQAVAIAVASLVLAYVPAHEASANRPPSGWRGALDASVGTMLLAFLVRVATAFLAATGRPDAERVYRQAAAVRKQIIDEGSDEIEQLYDNVRRSPAATDNKPGGVPERVEVGAEIMSTRLVTRARELIRLQLATEMGVTYKTWRTKRDSRVRTMHSAIEGDTVLLEEVFVQPDGAQLEYPGDPLAPLGATANCRCRLSYRMARV